MTSPPRSGWAASSRADYRTHINISDAQLVDAADRRWWTLATETWLLELPHDRRPAQRE